MEQNFEIVSGLLGKQTKVQLTIQTNGTLIDDDWIDLFRDYNVRVGVSLDGPKWLHDLHRKDRKGHGSFDATLRGLRMLQENNIDNYVLSVITRESLFVAQEFYNFFADIGVSDLGLIPEEIDGVNLISSLEGSDQLRDFEEFVTNLHHAYLAHNRKPEVREFRGAREALFYSKPIESMENNKTTAYHILTVGRDGSFTSFSPELAGMTDGQGDTYTFGNILTDGIRASVQTDKFRDFYSKFVKGVATCKANCYWFAFCGGGLPSNKIAETGRLDVAETMSCRLHLQSFAQTVLRYYNSQFQIRETIKGELS